MAFTGRFAAVLAVGVVPIVLLGPLAWPGLAGWLACVLALGAVDLTLAASPRRLGLERRLPDRARLGEEVRARLIVTNRGRRTLRARLRDAWPPSVQATARADLVVPPGERRQAVFLLAPSRRGRRLVRTVTVRARGPLGLVCRQATLACPGELRILPPFLSRRHLPSRLARLRELEGGTQAMIRGRGTEFDSLRDYVRGDDVRSIDWRASARTEDAGRGPRLMVRTWRPERDRRVVIVIDTGRAAAVRVGGFPRLDSSLEAALLLQSLAARAGDRVDLLAFDRVVRARVRGRAGRAPLARTVDAFAGLEPTLLETDWPTAAARVGELASSGALVVILTAAQASSAARGLLGALPTLTVRHSVLVAAATDPVLPALARERGDREAVYRAAAAERELLEARRLEEALRRAGAGLVAAGPDALAPALADRYLALKASGRL